jgi:hypothetical protein
LCLVPSAFLVPCALFLVPSELYLQIAKFIYGEQHKMPSMRKPV